MIRTFPKAARSAPRKTDIDIAVTLPVKADIRSEG